MNVENEALAREFPKKVDAQGDVFALLANDVEVSFRKRGAHGKMTLDRFFESLTLYLRSISHDQDTFKRLSGGDHACIEGLDSGQLGDDTSWRPDGNCAGRLCTMFQMGNGLISRVFIYLNPDYAGRTASYYP